ncbi:NAD-dependent epimerase/dehydratase family protein [Sphingomonas sp. GB1N7]|uniref:NAD-dependent epimerase/dehydratase family protein n=1 Tax=Parasphingomonas caseinilytica TaxID=3096158 RepID=UPI002FC5CEAC
MTRPAQRILVTGADGFIGARLVRALLADPRFADAVIMLNDLSLTNGIDDPRIVRCEGDFGDPAIRAKLVANTPDLVFHLAGILGGAAEADYPAARRVNVDATLVLLEALRNEDAPPRVVFASSIAVFGPPLPDAIDDDTTPLPTMIYGAQKRMMEIAVEQFSARGWIDGLALRLPGIVARPGADARLKSAFLNALFYRFAAGEAITLPVRAAGTTWLISVRACVAALLHAGTIERDRLGRRRAMTLPAQHVRFDDLVAAIGRRFPDSGARVDYAPDATIEMQFGSQPPLTTPLADALGFVHDGDIDVLVARAMEDGA